jgi:hypothetical protein
MDLVGFSLCSTVDTVPSVVSDVPVFAIQFCAIVFKAQCYDAISDFIVIGNTIEFEVLGTSWKREWIHGHHRSGVPTQLVGFGGIETHIWAIIFFIGISHCSRFIRVFASPHYAGMMETKVVSDFVHVYRNGHAPIIIVK